MSETLIAGLPRFDSTAPRGPANWRQPLDMAAPAALKLQASAPPVEAVASKAAVEAPPAPVRPADLVQVEASLKSIAARLDKMERDAQLRAFQAVQSMAAKLFPELSRQFLAAEISRSLPKLVPASASVIEIRAGEALAAEIQELIGRTPSLANRCTVLPSGSDSTGKVDVSWQTGGVSFDFEALLATLLSQLNPS